MPVAEEEEEMEEEDVGPTEEGGIDGSVFPLEVALPRVGGVLTVLVVVAVVVTVVVCC